MRDRHISVLPRPRLAHLLLVETEKFQRARKRVRDALIEDCVAGHIDQLVERLLAGAG